MESPVYYESQRMRLWWVYLICAGILGLAVFIFVQQIVLGIPTGTNPAPDWGVWAILAFAVWLIVLILLIKLQLRIGEKGIEIRFIPFTHKRFSWDKIESMEVVEYHPLRDFGGWGIRYNWKQKGKAFTVAGHFGLSLTMKDGKKVLIGTYKPEKLKLFVSKSPYLK